MDNYTTSTKQNDTIRQRREGDIQTGKSIQLSNGNSGDNDDTNSQGRIPQDDRNVPGYNTLDVPTSSTNYGYVGDTTRTSDTEAEEPMVRVCISPLQVGKTNTARIFLRRDHTPRHELAADIIDNITDIWWSWGNNVGRDIPHEEWTRLIENPLPPTDNDIEKLRRELHTRRCDHIEQRVNRNFTADMEELQRLNEY